MKKLIVSFMLIAMAILCGCNNARSKSSEEQEKSVDSIAEVERLSFHSLDLDRYNLKGHVKECIMRSYDKAGKETGDFHNLAFTKDGLVAIDESPYRGKLSFEYGESGNYLGGKDLTTEGMRVILKRDGDGRILNIQRKAATGTESDGQYELKHSYDKGNRLKNIECAYWEASEVIEFSYNENDGFVATEKNSVSDYESDIVTTKKYTYKKLDAYGNWLVRELATIEEKSVTEMGEEVAVTTQKVLPTLVEKREILYW